MNGMVRLLEIRRTSPGLVLEPQPPPPTRSRALAVELHRIKMASLSTVEGNSCVEVDIRFILKQCDCGELADVKITKSNKNNNRGRIYYSCKRQKCGSFLGWCKISSIEQKPFVIAPPEARELVVPLPILYPASSAIEFAANSLLVDFFLSWDLLFYWCLMNPPLILLLLLLIVVIGCCTDSAIFRFADAKNLKSVKELRESRDGEFSERMERAVASSKLAGKSEVLD
ncbi:uncharacterized protein A4U43_C07F24680 [Asparagus officinalis]|uniref:GRF-type domain-containing protein n=1 Tax=Asparagus officinalis TaxID=4686 RepID=A0A5P1EJV7_ASPOF|nr:uncharacterized protein A4U43_C07F24680 [Asparagus officinalis]